MRQQRSRRKTERNIRRKQIVTVQESADKAEKNKMRSRAPRDRPSRMSRMLHAADHSVTSRMGFVHHY
jgi:hypothetical protein